MTAWRIDFREQFEEWVQRDEPSEATQHGLYDWFFERVDLGPPLDATYDSLTEEYQYDLEALGLRVWYFAIGDPEYLLLVSGIKTLWSGR